MGTANGVLSGGRGFAPEPHPTGPFPLAGAGAEGHARPILTALLRHAHPREHLRWVHPLENVRKIGVFDAKANKILANEPERLDGIVHLELSEGASPEKVPARRGQRGPFRKKPVVKRVLLVAALLSPMIVWADLDAGRTAYLRDDFSTALKEFRALAQGGSATGQVLLGTMYYRGEGVAQDRAEAVKWFRKAAEQGNPDAQALMGTMCYSGEVVPQDFSEAVRWFRKAAVQGDADAQLLLGTMYEAGEGLEQDYAEAVKWWRRAAAQGQARAQGALGTMYRDGTGVLQDYAQAYAWYNVAAADGDETARKNRDAMTDSMTPTQLEEGQRLSKDLFEKYGRR